MVKIKGNDIVTGIMWGIVIHVGITVLLPRLKTINIQEIFSQFNVQAQPETPPPTTPPVNEPPEEPAEGEEEEEEPMEEEEEEEDYGENAEEYDEDSPEGQETSRRVNEMSGAGAARSSRSGSGRRSRGVGEDNIMAEYANRIRV